MKNGQRSITAIILLMVLQVGCFVARALNSSLPPGGNFDLSHWYLQLPTSGGVFTRTSGSVDFAPTAQILGGFTKPFFYTGPHGAWTFWVRRNGARTTGAPP